MAVNLLDSLLERLRAGDRSAVEQFFRDYEPVLRLVVRQNLSPFLRQQLDSVDVVQSAWLHVLQGRERANWEFADREELRAFLVRSVRNRLIDHVRRARASRRREQAAAVPERNTFAQPKPSEFVRAQELWERMLALCPPQHRQVLQFKQQGLTLDEIAARTGLHPGSVRRILYELARRLALGATQA
jgi:RNA polymerase sigma-70 factor (ECF subfamily)